MPRLANLARTGLTLVRTELVTPTCSKRRLGNRICTVPQLAVVTLFAMGAAHAAEQMAPLTVIHDAGRTVSISTYLEVLPTQTDSAIAEPQPSALNFSPAIAFPIHTASMSPGRLAANRTVALRLALPNPIFLLGTDPLSHDWLARNRTRLLEIGATGMVIEASSWEALRQIQRVAGGLPMSAACADELGELLRLSVYPILIERNGVISQ